MDFRCILNPPTYIALKQTSCMVKIMLWFYLFSKKRVAALDSTLKIQTAVLTSQFKKSKK